MKKKPRAINIQDILVQKIESYHTRLELQFKKNEQFLLK